MQVFRTYLQSIKKNKIVLQNISQGHSSRINGREPQQPRSHPGAYKSASWHAADLGTLTDKIESTDNVNVNLVYSTPTQQYLEVCRGRLILSVCWG